MYKFHTKYTQLITILSRQQSIENCKYFMSAINCCYFKKHATQTVTDVNMMVLNYTQQYSIKNYTKRLNNATYLYAQIYRIRLLSRDCSKA